MTRKNTIRPLPKARILPQLEDEAVDFNLGHYPPGDDSMLRAQPDDGLQAREPDGLCSQRVRVSAARATVSSRRMTGFFILQRWQKRGNRVSCLGHKVWSSSFQWLLRCRSIIAVVACGNWVDILCSSDGLAVAHSAESLGRRLLPPFLSSLLSHAATVVPPIVC